MFVELRSTWEFSQLRWYMTHDVLREFRHPVANVAQVMAYQPIACLAELPSRRAIKNEVKDVC